jgi:phage terminase large subunit-like protein
VATLEGARLGYGGDYTVGVKIAADFSTDPPTYYIIDVIREERLSPGQVENLMKSTAVWDGERCSICIPRDPDSAGKLQAGHLADKLQGFAVQTEPAQGDREVRATPLAAQCEHTAG